MAFGPFPIPFKLDRTRNASVQVYEHLRELITSLILVPGAHLDRAEMCSYFELSSTPVRDALTRLSEEGLMDIFKQQATIVRVIDVEAIAEAHFLRCAMELEVVDVLARQRDPMLVNTLESHISQQAFANARGDYDTFVRLDMEFHRHMFRAAKVEDLWDFLRTKSGNLDRLERLQSPQANQTKIVLADHASIVGAIASGNGRLAQISMREHLSGMLQQLETLRERYPAYFSER